ncbi:MAG: sugar ABC transporter permease [Lachnospiraceae bacterium]|nr:sugar ABC transporter permease [Lachnospiraceae bacterium]MBR5762474.1 sugar ABC transporter permease [Lachnospiraceae bacterium]MBR5993130.1 sugar ABC transporter permease [Lachnospiraceae bacterium]
MSKNAKIDAGGRTAWNRFIYNNNTVGHIFAAPFIIGFLVFTIIPMISSLYYSCTDYNMIEKENWIGLANYVNLFKDPRFLNSIRVTLQYVVLSVPLKLAFALFIAFLLTRPSKAVSFYRSLYYLPSLIGGSVAVALVWKELFARKGLINSILGDLGIHAINWFGNMSTAKWPIILMTVWQFGSSMLIFAAGLKEIPTSYYEAAKIDGANGWQSFWKITMPCLSPIILFNLIMQLISSFMVFTQAFVITQGGPNDATMYYALYVYKQGIQTRNMGYASAMSWVMLVIMSAVTAIVFKTSNHWVFKESEG